MNVAEPTRLVFADALTRGVVILEECRGQHDGSPCFYRVAHTDTRVHELTVLDLRVEDALKLIDVGGPSKTVFLILVNEDGEQVSNCLGGSATMRVVVRMPEVAS